MASSGFLADFSKRPAGQKIGIFVVIALLGGALYYQLSFSKVRKDLKDAELAADELVTREASLKKDEGEYKRLEDERKQLEKMITENENALPTAAQLDSFFDMINRKVGEAGVEVKRWDRIKEILIEESIYKVPVEIELAGTFYEIKKFFYLLYKMNQKEGDTAAAKAAEPKPDAKATPTEVKERDRILTIEDLHLKDPVISNGELVLTVTFRASTFRKEPTAPAEDDKKKDGKAKEPAKSTGKKPMTQQMKEDTEDAMKKSEDRVKEVEEKVEGSGTGADRVKGGM